MPVPASVVSESTCVSPRWNSPEPCVRGTMPTLPDSGRRSRRPRPSGRAPFSRISARTARFSSASKA